MPVVFLLMLMLALPVASSEVFQRYNVAIGLANYVMALQADDVGNIWAGTDKGLVRIERRTGNIRVYDVNDGLPSNQFWNHATYLSPDGTVYFGAMNGLVSFKPREMKDNPVSPPVYITALSLFNQAVTPRPGSLLHDSIQTTRAITLDHSQSSLGFKFAALNYRWPKKNRYAYKLEGFDRDWTRVDSSSREASYTNLPPGRYVFRVKASNNDGVWNDTGASLTITIAPPWWQTLWFRAFCLVGFAALLGWIYQMRLRQVTRGFERQLEARVSERTRIARELHDTLLQSFQGLLLRFQTVANRLPQGPVRQNLEGAIEEGSEAIAEGREAIQELRSSASSHSGTLEVALNTLGQRLAATPCEPSVPSMEVDVRGTTRVLHPVVRDEIYRIAAEALRNAFKHAKAQRIEGEVRYEDRHLVVAVRDDGVGTDLQLLKRGQVSGHFGLHGMRERSGILNAQLEVWTEKGSGTEVELSVPGHVAYTGLQNRPRILTFRMFDGKPRRRLNDRA